VVTAVVSWLVLLIAILVVVPSSAAKGMTATLGFEDVQRAARLERLVTLGGCDLRPRCLVLQAKNAVGCRCPDDSERAPELTSNLSEN
jgi:hypothetical protein